MEVRCCCVPGKLLGTIETSVQGDHIVFPLRGNNFRTVQLNVALFRPAGNGEPYRVLKSDDYPIELLRQISTFKEAT